ncbi:class I SAM-dependent methyltransferase [Marinobacter lipolyticus]|uniref:class I SAM-dependent methyltransferase n=1 Tax=Marinobacter lipolyticus TaxID=209639 RepID=UPI001BD0D413|nr:class I SAM-dependent methyltransferase [Marinobacter lipolyticus]MBS8241778.1 class I SAM-dependent methyltransferase [Marinobacter lipolyticus]
MSALPNAHEALLRNREHIVGRLALLGLSDTGLLSALPGGGLAVTDHAGVFAAAPALQGWRTAFGYDDPALQPGCADTIVVFLPKARAELAFRLALAGFLAADGARLIVIGEKREGIAGAVKQVKAVAPEATKVDSARHCQVWLADGFATGETFELQRWMSWHAVEAAGVRVDVAGLPGIFSDGEPDQGTLMLLETLAEQPLPRGHSLDFACGSGVIGCWIQAWQRSAGIEPSPIDAVDVQSQAVLCAGATYRRSQAVGDVLASDGLAAVTRKYRAIVTNPPFHAGVRTDTTMTEQFLRQAAAHLQPGGELRLVANSFLPYEAVIRKTIGPVTRLASDKRFTVYSAKRQT